MYICAQIGMLKCVVTLYEESQKAIADSPVEKRITWSYIKTTLAPLIQKVIDTKFLVSCVVLFGSFCVVFVFGVGCFVVIFFCLFVLIAC